MTELVTLKVNHTLVPLHIVLTTLQGLGSTSLALGAATDIVTALVLSFYLNGMRTGYKRSEALITKLIGFSVRTVVLTSAVSLAVLVLVCSGPLSLRS